MIRGIFKAFLQPQEERRANIWGLRCAAHEHTSEQLSCAGRRWRAVRLWGGDEAEEEQEAPRCAQVWDRLLPS